MCAEFHVIEATATMPQQITRDNHYVPQWYQRGFLARGKHKLHVLNLRPTTKYLHNGEALVEPEVEELGPKLTFVWRDLYTTRQGSVLNDDIETFLFGRIDKSGADAVRGWIAGDPIKIHRRSRTSSNTWTPRSCVRRKALTGF